MKKVIRVLLVAGATASLLMGQSARGEPANGCALPGLASPGPPALVDFSSCSYTAAGPGIYTGYGTPWCIDITRASVLVERICSNNQPHAGYLETKAGDVVTLYLAFMPIGCSYMQTTPYCWGAIAAFDQR